MPPEENVFFFVSAVASEEKQTKGRSSRSLKGLLKFVQAGRSYKMRKRPHLVPSRFQLAKSIHWIQRWGSTKVQSLGYCTLVFVLCDSVPVDAKSTSSLRQTMFLKIK